MSGEGEKEEHACHASAEAAAAATEEQEEAAKGDDEDTGAQVAPIVKLEEISISTGEENEAVLLDLKSKLYRFDKEGKLWKERGVGQVKLLKHKETEKVRLLMRQTKTLKICANHLVLSTSSLQEHAGSDKSWVWHATDFSDGDLKEELFCIRFGSAENAQKFKDIFEEAQESTQQKSEEIEKSAESTADTLENLNVKEPDEDSLASHQSKENTHSKEDTLSLDRAHSSLVHLQQGKHCCSTLLGIFRSLVARSTCSLDITHSFLVHLQRKKHCCSMLLGIPRSPLARKAPIEGKHMLVGKNSFIYNKPHSPATMKALEARAHWIWLIHPHSSTTRKALM